MTVKFFKSKAEKTFRLLKKTFRLPKC